MLASLGSHLVVDGVVAELCHEFSNVAVLDFALNSRDHGLSDFLNSRGLDIAVELLLLFVSISEGESEDSELITVLGGGITDSVDLSAALSEE